MRKQRRPGYLGDLSDSWTTHALNHDLSKRAGQMLETQSNDFIDTRSGAARAAPKFGIKRPTIAKLSSPEFLMKNAKWYRDYRTKVLGPVP